MKNFPPLTKGGRGDLSAVVTENQNPPRSLFFKGGSRRGAMVCCGSREATLFLESVWRQPPSRSSPTLGYLLTTRSHCNRIRTRDLRAARGRTARCRILILTRLLLVP